MKIASMPATPREGVRATAAPVVAGADELLVSEPVLEPPLVVVPFEDVVVSEPPSTATPGKLADA